MNIVHLVTLDDITPSRATVTAVHAMADEQSALDAATTPNYAVVADASLVPAVGERVWIARSGRSRGRRIITARGEAVSIESVIVALKDVADVHADSADRGHITGLAPDSSDYDGVTEPGSAWDEECDARIEVVRDALPAGWSAEWSDDDVVITRDGGAL